MFVCGDTAILEKRAIRKEKLVFSLLFFSSSLMFTFLFISALRLFFISNLAVLHYLWIVAWEPPERNKSHGTPRSSTSMQAEKPRESQTLPFPHIWKETDISIPSRILENSNKLVEIRSCPQRAHIVQDLGVADIVSLHFPSKHSCLVRFYVSNSLLASHWLGWYPPHLPLQKDIIWRPNISWVNCISWLLGKHLKVISGAAKCKVSYKT